jgi:hypothetical protein
MLGFGNARKYSGVFLPISLFKKYRAPISRFFQVKYCCERLTSFISVGSNFKKPFSSAESNISCIAHDYFLLVLWMCLPDPWLLPQATTHRQKKHQRVPLPHPRIEVHLGITNEPNLPS